MALADAAKCFSCLSAPTLREIAVYLACQWANASPPVDPSAPTGLTFNNLSNAASVILLWTAPVLPPAPDHYEVWRSVNGAAFALLTTVVAATATDSSGMAAGDLYTYKVRSKVGSSASIFTATVTAGNSLVFNGTGIVGAVAYTDLLICFGNLGFLNQAGMTSFSAPALTRLDGELQFQTTGLLALSLPSLLTIAGSQIISNNSLASLAWNAFSATTGDVVAKNNAALVTVNLGSLGPFQGDFYLIDFSGNALSAASVNGILARGIASNVGGCDFELAGGTNAAPTGQGVTDAGILSGQGNTVVTN